MATKKPATTFTTLTNDEAGDRIDRKSAAAFLGVSVALLAADVITERHKIPFIRMGRRKVYSKMMLRQWMAARVVNAPVNTPMA